MANKQSKYWEWNHKAERWGSCLPRRSLTPASQGHPRTAAVSSAAQDVKLLTDWSANSCFRTDVLEGKHFNKQRKATYSSLNNTCMKACYSSLARSQSSGTGRSHIPSLWMGLSRSQDSPRWPCSTKVWPSDTLQSPAPCFERCPKGTAKQL